MDYRYLHELLSIASDDDEQLHEIHYSTEYYTDEHGGLRNSKYSLLKYNEIFIS